MKGKILFLCTLGVLLLVLIHSNAASASDVTAKLKEIYSLAGKGQLPSSQPFGIDSKFDDIKKSWGNPIDMEGILLGFKDKNVCFNSLDYNDEESQKTAAVTIIIPSEEMQQEISLDTLKNTLGQPTQLGDQDEYTLTVCYEINGNYLEFALSRDDEEEEFTVDGYILCKFFLEDASKPLDTPYILGMKDGNSEDLFSDSASLPN